MISSLVGRRSCSFSMGSSVPSVYGFLRMLQPVLVGLTLVLGALLVMQSVTPHAGSVPTRNGTGAVKTTGTGGGGAR